MLSRIEALNRMVIVIGENGAGFIVDSQPQSSCLFKLATISGKVPSGPIICLLGKSETPYKCHHVGPLHETPSCTRLDFIKRLSLNGNEELSAICYAAYLMMDGSNS